MMRFRSVGYEPKRIDISDTIVVSNDYNFRNIAAEIIGHRCLVVGDIHEANRYLHKMQSVTIVDSRVDVLAASIGNLDEAWRLDSSNSLSVVVPSRHLFRLIEYLQKQAFSDELTLVRFSQENANALLTFSPSKESDRPIDHFLKGYKTAELFRSESSWATDDECSNCELYQRRLLSALETIDAVDPYERNRSESTRSRQQSDLERLKNELAQLNRERDSLRTQLTALEQRYTALAGSNLGKATLRYWSWRHRSGRSAE